MLTDIDIAVCDLWWDIYGWLIVFPKQLWTWSSVEKKKLNDQKNDDSVFDGRCTSIVCLFVASEQIFCFPA